MTRQLSALPGFKPLYQQVKDLLLERLIGGYWKPGDLLPSEMQLAEARFQFLYGPVSLWLDF